MHNCTLHLIIFYRLLALRSSSLTMVTSRCIFCVMHILRSKDFSELQIVFLSSMLSNLLLFGFRTKNERMEPVWKAYGACYSSVSLSFCHSHLNDSTPLIIACPMCMIITSATIGNPLLLY